MPRHFHLWYTKLSECALSTIQYLFRLEIYGEKIFKPLINVYEQFFQDTDPMLCSFYLYLAVANSRDNQGLRRLPSTV